MDSEDGKLKGLVNFGQKIKSVLDGNSVVIKENVAANAEAPVSKYCRNYKMSHLKRGKCIIFRYETYKETLRLMDRDFTDGDSMKCKKVFSKLKYEVLEYKNLMAEEVTRVLDQASREDHSDEDSLVVIFMSHGHFDERMKKEMIFTYDQPITTSDLWKPFSGSKCPTLAGKPKLFFIQACRGTEIDRGVNMKLRVAQRVSPNGMTSYTIPSHADTLIMWASYAGHIAYVSGRNDINGSVFIHYLTETVDEEATKDDLTSILGMVIQKVATEYQSNIPTDPNLDQNKQIPVFESTLMRKIYFHDTSESEISIKNNVPEELEVYKDDK